MARLVFVHAHPDDETLATGVTLAHYACAGHDVHVVTATLGELGEIIPPELAGLGAHRDDTLGAHRAGELAQALAALGVQGHHLGGRGRYRDSGMLALDHGMAGMPPETDPRSFVAADVDTAATTLRTMLDELDPDVVVTYDRHGGYGHPDHIQTRRVVERALAGRPAGRALAAYEVVIPLSWAQQDRRWLADHVPAEAGVHVPGLDEPYAVGVVDDAVVTHVVHDEAAVERQLRALRAHRSQVRVFDGWYALSNAIAHRLSGREAFVRLDVTTGERLPREGQDWVEGLTGEAHIWQAGPPAPGLASPSAGGRQVRTGGGMRA